MRFIADLHVHSHRSVATSKESRPEWLDWWARRKGITVVGTGDCVHPGYCAELKEKLSPAGNGLFRLKKAFRVTDSACADAGDVYFALTTEISSIYRKNGAVRKVHSLCVLPDFRSVAFVQKKLEAVGNIASDGRPILGLDAKDLLAIVLDAGAGSYVIPAHIWTPWFSVLGARSGFDRVEECFEDLTDEVFAVETGLSSDPAMNRRCSFLDRFRLVSNSDAHSPAMLGREANIFDTDVSYQGIYEALKFDLGFTGTIEFFPEEGKYHYDGHRACDVCLEPDESLRAKGMCPVCKKPLTMGVATRVAALADRAQPVRGGKQTYCSVTPLLKIIAHCLRTKSTASKKVRAWYDAVLAAVGSEFDVLLVKDVDEIRRCGFGQVADCVARMRRGDVVLRAGYDGVFGAVTFSAAAE